MYQSSRAPRGDSPVSIIGAGIAGAWQALLFAQAGHAVTLHERSDEAMMLSTSHWAGGMLAPYCESEVAEPIISRLGLRALDLWRRELPDTPFNGSLVVAHARDRDDFERFAQADLRPPAARCARRSPNSSPRWRAVSATALFFADEGHVEPRRVLPKLHERIIAAGGTIKFNSEPQPADIDGIVIDCRGLAARDTQPELRGVKGEMILIETDEVELARPVRLIHPRWPLYVIPREDNLFMLGATSIEAEDCRRQRALGAGAVGRGLCGASGVRRSAHRRIRLRPAAGLSRQSAAHRDRQSNHIAVNGLYRHGFLIAPALAELTLGYVEHGRIDNEVMRCA